MQNPGIPQFGFGSGTGTTGTGTAPAATSGAPTLSFGSTAPFSFGSGATAAAAPAPATGGFSFGAPQMPTAASTGLTLGTPQQSAFSFGAPAPIAAATAVVAPSGATGGFSFGAPTAGAPASTGLTLSQPSAPTFGATVPTASVAPSSSTGFSFGAPQPQPATTSAGLTLGTSQPQASAPAFSFGTSTTTTTAPTSTTGFSFGTTPAAAPAAPGLTLGTSQPSAFSFGSTAPTSTVAPTSTTSFGFGSNVISTTPASQPGTTTATSTFSGLGGVHAPGTGGLMGLSGIAAKAEGRAVLELPVPPEIMEIIEELKTHMKNQKVKLTELSRASDKGIDKVTETAEETRVAISNLSNQVHRQMLFCNTLMKSIQEELKNVDMAMVTRDTPFVLQSDITAPTNYFYNLVGNYQERMLTYKREIERAEITLASLAETQGFSSKDLIAALRGTKGTVMVLAAKVQDLHEQVVNEVAVNRNLKRFVVGGEHSKWPGGSSRGRTTSTGPMFPGSAVNFGATTRMDPIVTSSYNRAYDKLDVLFYSPNKSADTGGFPPGMLSSTPLSAQFGYTSPSPLFQTASSTILGSPGGALKRSKR